MHTETKQSYLLHPQVTIRPSIFQRVAPAATTDPHDQPLLGLLVRSARLLAGIRLAANSTGSAWLLTRKCRTTGS